MIKYYLFIISSVGFLLLAPPIHGVSDPNIPNTPIQTQANKHSVTLEQLGDNKGKTTVTNLSPDITQRITEQEIKKFLQDTDPSFTVSKIVIDKDNNTVIINGSVDPSSLNDNALSNELRSDRSFSEVLDTIGKNLAFWNW